MDDIRSLLESDIDNGLLWWHDLLEWPLLPALSALTDSDVASYEIYVQRMAGYRKGHPSPIQKVFSSPDREQARAYRELSEEVGSIVLRYAP